MSAHLECSLIIGAAQDRSCLPRLLRLSTIARGWGCALVLLYASDCDQYCCTSYCTELTLKCQSVRVPRFRAL